MDNKKNVVQFTPKASTKELKELLAKQEQGKEVNTENPQNPILQYEEWVETMDRKDLVRHAKIKFFKYKEKRYDDERAYWHVKKDISELMVELLYKVVTQNRKEDVQDLYNQYNFIHENPNLKFTHYVTIAYALTQIRKPK